MTTGHLHAAALERLRKLAGLAAALEKNEQAQDLWAAKHSVEFGTMPSLILYADFGHRWLEGLVIKGERTDRDWDLLGPFEVLTEDGVLRTVDGWMAVDLCVQASGVEDAALRPDVVGE